MRVAAGAARLRRQVVRGVGAGRARPRPRARLRRARTLRRRRIDASRRSAGQDARLCRSFYF